MSYTLIKGSWGQGFRAPTFNELFFPAFEPCPAFGNPNLKPEESQSWDAGVEQHLWSRRIRLGATYFRNDFTNLIQSTLTGVVAQRLVVNEVGRLHGVSLRSGPGSAVTRGLAKDTGPVGTLPTGRAPRR